VEPDLGTGWCDARFRNVRGMRAAALFNGMVAF